MSDKFFFKGRPQNKPRHVSHSYSSKRVPRPGTVEAPIELTVNSEARQSEIEAILKDHGLHANITLDVKGLEDIRELESLLNTAKTIKVEKKPNRNDPCSCGSGKKYKVCCAN